MNIQLATSEIPSISRGGRVGTQNRPQRVTNNRGGSTRGGGNLLS